MELLFIVLALLAGYLLGSLPFGVWVARAHGVDIFSVGSGNPGATNVKRSVGKRAGNLVFMLDFVKGYIATLWPLMPFSHFVHFEQMAVAGMVGAIIGHSYSCFINFRGGKGVATSLGGLLALSWPVTLAGIGVWALVFFTTRYVSLASIILAASLPIAAWILQCSAFLVWFFVVLAAFIILRHRSNIQRLLAGEEHRFTKKQPDSAP